VQPKGRGQSQQRGSEDKGKETEEQRYEYIHLGKRISGSSECLAFLLSLFRSF